MKKKLLSIVLCLCMFFTLENTGIVTVHSADSNGVTAYLNSCTYDGTSIRAQIAFENLNEDCVMYAGVYSIEGYMKRVNKYNIQADLAESLTIRISDQNIQSSDILKIFFFDTQTGVKPLCKSLEKVLGKIKLVGAVVGTNIIKYNNMNCNVDEIIFRIDDACDNEDWSAYEGDTVNISVANNLNASGYFGMAVNVFLEPAGTNSYQIVDIESISDVKKLNIDDIDEDTTDSEIVYYPVAGSYKTSKYMLSDNAEFYYNYVVVNSIDDIIKNVGGLKEGVDIEITLIENSGDTAYDIVIAKEYSYDRVSVLDIEKGTFEGVYNSYAFDFDDENLNISITNKSGENIELADFNIGDVIAYISDTNKGIVNANSASWIELVNLGENNVKGVVNKVSNNAVCIDNYEYCVLTPICVGDEGTFYLTKTGKIFDYEKDAGNYAYILETGLNCTGFSCAWQVKLLTKNNEIVIYTVRDNFKIDDVTYKEDADNAGILSDLEGVDFKAQVADRVITYKLDSKGLIKEINSASVSSMEGKFEYKYASQKLGNILEDNTTIFDISQSSMSNVKAHTIDWLVDGCEYSCYTVQNEYGKYDCVIITSAKPRLYYSNNIAFTTEIWDIVYEEDAYAKEITYCTDGSSEPKTIIIVDDQDVSMPKGEDTRGIYENLFGAIELGTIMMYDDNGEGVAEEYTILATANSATSADSPAYYLNNAALSQYVECGKNGLIGGYIKSWTFNDGYKIINAEIVDAVGNGVATGECELIVSNEVNSYTYYNRTSSKINIIPGDWAAVESIDVADYDSGQATYFLAFTVDGDVKDFITFSTRKSIK